MARSFRPGQPFSVVGGDAVQSGSKLASFCALVVKINFSRLVFPLLLLLLPYFEARELVFRGYGGSSWLDKSFLA